MDLLVVLNDIFEPLSRVFTSDSFNLVLDKIPYITIVIAVSMIAIYLKERSIYHKKTFTQFHDFKPEVGKHNFRVSNFQGIHNIDVNLPFDSSWIFLTGQNGYGKTNILQALARGLSKADDERVYDGIKPIGLKAKIIISIDGQENTIPKIQNSSLPFQKMGFRVLGYGASRLEMGSDRSTKEYKPCSSLFESQVLLRNIEKEGLSRWYFKSKEKEKFEDCVNKFKQLMPNLEDVIVDDNNEVWYVEKDTNGHLLPKVQFQDLATGYQNIISMVGDIILNLSMSVADYELESLEKKMRAIVLIDELELYLHPRLQKKLPTILTELFPNVLFIASTHSPIPILGAPQNSAIYSVGRTAENGIFMERLDNRIDFDELLPNAILTSPVFGMEDIFSNNFKGDKPIYTDNNYNEVLFKKAIDKKIQEINNDEIESALIERYKNRHEK
ncbi:ATPase [Moritella viscosa]|uniref:ATPase n=2 Tax=Moritella viscosa TaxID=80854 RepID=A0ABY1HCN5_9GAMM|nr:ATPase [Moritella viscosa]